MSGQLKDARLTDEERILVETAYAEVYSLIAEAKVSRAWEVVGELLDAERNVEAFFTAEVLVNQALHAREHWKKAGPVLARMQIPLRAFIKERRL